MRPRSRVGDPGRGYVPRVDPVLAVMVPFAALTFVFAGIGGVKNVRAMGFPPRGQAPGVLRWMWAATVTAAIGIVLTLVVITR